MDSFSDSSGEIAFQAPALPAKDAPCPVCGEAVGAAPTKCPTCATPHHFDCWEYNEGCGVYGCKAKVRREPVAEANTVALPAKLGMPHKRVGSYAGVWWVPPFEGLTAVLFEVLAIASLSGGHVGLGLGALAAMVATIAFIAVSSVRYYVDFEHRMITKAKSVAGRDLLEWNVESLDGIESLELRLVHDGLSQLGGAPPLVQVLAIPKALGYRPLEIAPPLRLDEPGVRELADLFRRIRASGAFAVTMPEEVARLEPPVRNELLLEAGKKSS